MHFGQLEDQRREEKKMAEKRAWQRIDIPGGLLRIADEYERAERFLFDKPFRGFLRFVLTVSAVWLFLFFMTYFTKGVWWDSTLTVVSFGYGIVVFLALVILIWDVNK